MKAEFVLKALKKSLDSLPPNYIVGDTWESIEFPEGHTKPDKIEFEDNYLEVENEEQIPTTSIIGSKFEVGTANLFVDTTTSNVGIGTASPGYKLDVDGNVHANYFIGDGSQLDGISSTLQQITDNGNTTSNTIQFTNENVGLVATGNIEANYFIGDGSGLTSLNADNLGSGTVPSARLSLVASDIPSLDADKITTGTIDSARLSLVASDIPSLDADKITTGTIDSARLSLVASDIPSLDADKITTGTIDSARLSLVASDIPSLDADKITTGTIDSARLSLVASDIPSLDADKITSGTLGAAQIPTTLNNTTIESAGNGTLTISDSSGDNQSYTKYITTAYTWSTGIHGQGGSGGQYKIANGGDLGTNTRVTIDTAGQVGIATDSPAYTLDVNGTVNTGVLTATSVSGDGSGLTSLNADNLGSGTVPSVRLSLVASDIPSLDADKITTGTLGVPINTTTGTFSGRVDSDRYLTSNTFSLPDPNQHSFRHVCMITQSDAPYGLTQAGGCIYEYNPLTGDTVRVVEPVSEPTAGTFTAIVGREYFPMGSPMTMVNTHKTVPFTNLC